MSAIKKVQFQISFLYDHEELVEKWKEQNPNEDLELLQIEIDNAYTSKELGEFLDKYGVWYSIEEHPFY
jgi:hypothetical protein